MNIRERLFWDKGCNRLFFFFSGEWDGPLNPEQKLIKENLQLLTIHKRPSLSFLGLGGGDTHHLVDRAVQEQRRFSFSVHHLFWSLPTAHQVHISAR